jgi:hypothetical protein
MDKLGIVIFGETDNVSYCNTVEEAQTLAKHGAEYIRDNLNSASHPVSFVGLMLDQHWMDHANDMEKGTAGGLIAGICYDTAFQSRLYHGEFYRHFEVPTFLFAAFKQHLDQASYSYYLRLVGVVEWTDHDALCHAALQGFVFAQKRKAIEYADDSIAQLLMMDLDLEAFAEMPECPLPLAPSEGSD